MRTVLSSRLLILVTGLLLLQSCVFSQNHSAQKPSSIWATEWSHDGNYIAVGGDDSIVWMYNGHDHALYKSFLMNSMVKGLSWHPSEKLLAVATMKGVQLLDMQTEQLVTIPGLPTGGRGVAWNFNGQLLALADGAGIVQIMDKQGKIIKRISKYNKHSYLTIDWHPSKNILVTGSDEIILFDTSGKQLAFINHRKEHTSVLTAKWHPSGEFFATGDYGHEKEGMPTLLQFWKEDGTLVKSIKGPHHSEIRNLRWSPDGRQLATASDALRIWSKQGELLGTGKSETDIWGIAWSRDGQSMVTGNFANGAVKLWNSKAQMLRVL